jgi:hypothetical protein
MSSSPWGLSRITCKVQRIIHWTCRVKTAKIGARATRMDEFDNIEQS